VHAMHKGYVTSVLASVRKFISMVLVLGVGIIHRQYSVLKRTLCSVSSHILMLG
jgi:hypothetical protein